MRKIQKNSLKGLALSGSAIAMAVAGQAWAQEEDDCAVGEEFVGGECVLQSDGPDGVTTNEAGGDDVVDVTDTGATGQQDAGAIVVTGSRIKRDTYTSISPLQVLTSETENETGLFDPSQILQRSESASGTQIDATFQGFVLDNGPGSQTLNLRGLGADRTLLLLNGRRIAPAGVEGAPSAPSINLLPGSLIDRYDLLLDGASSVYGSDAIAGVGNVILRKDFDGLELFGRGEINPQGAGEDFTVSAAYGLNFDRGFIGFGAEFDRRDAIRLKDRDFFSGCDTEYEVTDTGEIRTLNVRNDAIIRAATNGQLGVRADPCKLFVGAAAIQVPGLYDSTLFFQDANGNVGVPGGNTGIPNFSVRQDAFGDFRDDNNDGIVDVDYADYNVAGLNPNQTYLSGQDLYNVMAYGEYTFPGAANLTPFFEANYSRAEITSDNNGAGNIALYVPGSNPFNPCNIDTGVDCAAADNEFLGIVGAPFALPTGQSLTARSFFSIRGDRDNVEVTQEQYRGVLGVRGDLPFIAPSWTFELAGVYSRSEGRSVRRGIREDKLAFALGIDPTGDFNNDGVIDNDGDGIADDFNGGIQRPPLTGGACNASGLANPDLAAPDLLEGCVPVNVFAPSVFGLPFGDFASQAERDYVFGTKVFDTTYEQKIVNGFVTGNLFDLPAGPVGAVLGFEYRDDSIESLPDFVTFNGLFVQQNSDKGTTGSKETKEAFAEIDIPLQAGKPFVRELNVNLSGRITDDELYGTNYTYSLKGGWRPIEPLLLKFSYGTSFRAPNLRENFLGGQSGFPTLIDPCAVPPGAYDPLAPEGERYDPDEDNREPTTLDNCIREGRDPFRVGISPLGTNTTQTVQPLSTTGGSLDIDPETSRSITTGFAFEETFFSDLDVSIGFNYYDIKVKDSIIEPSSQFIVNDCFTRQDGTRSPFCDRITVDTDAENTRLLISAIDSGFINLNEESVRGIDINTNFGKEITGFGRIIDLGLNVRANHLIERSSLFIGDNGDPSVDNDEGEFGFPKWTGRGTFTAEVDKILFTYGIRYTGPVEQQADGIDPLSDAFGRGPDGQPTGFQGNTCLGNGSGINDPDTGEFIPDGVVEGDGVFCRDIGYGAEQFLHTASIRYRSDRFTVLVGVDNIFNTAPPLVDGNEVFSIANTAIGSGYDYDGREFFASVTVEF